MAGAVAQFLAVLGDRVLSGREAEASDVVLPVRPEGRVVWCLCPDSVSVRALEGLAARLSEARPDLAVVAALPRGSAPEGVLAVPPPPEDGGGLARYLDHWRPSAVLLFGSVFRPALVAAAGRRGPVMGVALREPGRSWMTRWAWRRLARAELGRPRWLLCEDEGTAMALLRLGAPPERIVVTGLMAPSVSILPSNEAERESIAELISSRPVWCAAALPMEELAPVIEAHRLALQRAHRLLLVIVPDDPAKAPEMRVMLAAEGWTVGLRSDGEDPTDEMSVYIADLGGQELGLWLRLAAIAFLGGTLSSAAPGRSPMEAAALGSAILHGPETGAYDGDYRRLSQAGATLMVSRPADIAGAVEALIAPDHAAAMAHAAWEVSTAGEDAIARTLDALADVVPPEAA